MAVSKRTVPLLRPQLVGRWEVQSAGRLAGPVRRAHGSMSLNQAGTWFGRGQPLPVVSFLNELLPVMVRVDRYKCIVDGSADIAGVGDSSVVGKYRMCRSVAEWILRSPSWPNGIRRGIAYAAILVKKYALACVPDVRRRRAFTTSRRLST